MIGVDESYTEVDAEAASGGVAGDAGSSAGDAGSAGDPGGTAGSSGTMGSSGDGGSPPDAGSETCDNSVDDDADGKLDCFDSDCDASALCAGKCNGVGTLPCNVVRAAQNSGMSGATQRVGPPAYRCSQGERSGPEYAYRFAGNAGDNVFVALSSLTRDLGLFLTDVASGSACDAAAACTKAADASTGIAPEALSFSSGVGRDYFLIVDGPAASSFSISVQCSTPSGCAPAQAIETGQSIDSSNTLGNANVTSNLTRYSCAGGDRTFPEAAFMFTPSATGDYQVTLRNLTTNFDLFIIPAPNCTATCLHGTARSISASTQDESVTFSAAANTTYYLVVDGYGTGTFRLAVAAL